MKKQLNACFKINRSSPIPLHYQIKTQLLKLIQSNYFKPGDKLPTEVEFCELLDISRPTIRQAFSELINEGYITRQKARGTFVSQPKVEGFFFEKLESYEDEMKQLGLTPSTRLLKKEIEPAIQECKDIFHCDEVLHLVRLRYADEEERVLVDSYIPINEFPNLEDNDFEHDSLYHILQRDYQNEVVYVDRVIEAKKANSYVRSLLNMNSDAVVLQVITTAYTKEDRAVEYSIATYRGDRNKFRMRLEKK